jgi:hypothetical protein
MTDENPPIDHSDVFRTRALLPVLIPVAILVVVVGVIVLFAWLLLYNTREGAVALAIVAAGGVLMAVSLAASQDSLSRVKQVGAALALVVPLGLGIAIATGSDAFGIASEDLNINVEPHGPSFLLPDVPEDAPLMAAESLDSFCLPTDGGCEDTNEWSVELPEDPALFAYAFHNMDTTTEHNLALFGLPEEDAYGANVEALGTEPLTPEVPATFIGDETRAYEFAWGGGGEGEDAPAEGEGATAPEQFYFVCTIHPATMWGVATVQG